MAAHFFCLVSCMLRNGSKYGTIKIGWFVSKFLQIFAVFSEGAEQLLSPTGTKIVSVTCHHVKLVLKVSPCCCPSVEGKVKGHDAGLGLGCTNVTRDAAPVVTSDQRSSFARPVLHPLACSGCLWFLGNWNSIFRPSNWVSDSATSSAVT